MGRWSGWLRPSSATSRAAPKPGDFLGEPERHWPLQQVEKLKIPVIGLYAGKDAGIPVADVDAMRTAMQAAARKDVEFVVYPAAQHGFHADYRASYNEEAARDAWARMLEYFRAHGVGPRPPKR